MMFGGRVAEELKFGEDKVTTGAEDDIRQATDLAHRMVTEFGFGSKLGPVRYAAPRGFRGPEGGQGLIASEASAGVIDLEVRRIVEEGEVSARRILTENLDQLDHLIESLLKYETLTGEEVRALVFEPARACR
jgi:cell division protease FtsH